MNKTLNTYQQFFCLILALYVYLGKGIAYGFFAEATLLLGLLFLIFRIRHYEIIWDIKTKIMTALLFLNIAFIVRGIAGYPLIDTVRDSFVLNYMLFAFIILLFKQHFLYFLQSIFKIYKFYPIITLILYLLSLNKQIADFELLGPYHLLYFKFGDMSVHLFVAFVLQLTNLNQFKKPFDFINLLIILFLFSIASSYSRGGMLGFIFAFGLFYYFVKDHFLINRIKTYLKYLVLAILIITPILLSIKVEENFQGRKAGAGQVVNNFTSIFVDSEDGSLSDNKLWRLLWWGKIIDYSFSPNYILQGKGLGMSLAADDDIIMDSADVSELRSPHNFNLTIMARYGVPIFILWCIWLYFNFRRFKSPNLSKLELIILSIQVVFLFNASFDVFLEGPMGAFPFWVFVGIDLSCLTLSVYGSKNELDLFESTNIELS